MTYRQPGRSIRPKRGAGSVISSWMRRANIERWSFRAALALGFCVTLGLWLYTGYSFTNRIETVRHEAGEVSSRYLRAQELLSTVRTQVLLSSVRVRDALLDPSPTSVSTHRTEIEAAHRIIMMALQDYEPVIAARLDGDAVQRLTNEVDQFHQTSLAVIANAAGRSPAAVREVLNSAIAPRREAALAISEEIQALNRRAFVRQQQDLTDIHRIAELQSRRQLGAALIVGLGVLLITSLYAGRLEKRLRDQLERDARISRELQQTAAKVLNAQEEERRTIARELHDEVGQVLTAIRVELDVAQRSILQAGGPAATLTEAQTITDSALTTVRNLTQLLHPAALDDLGLQSVIDAALRGMQRRHNIRTQLHPVDLPEHMPREVEMAAYRIVQEGLNNIAKHARASRCDIRLTQLSDRLLVEIEDDGIGFVEDTDRPIVARGLGLISMRERAARLGGTFNILSTPGQGTKLIISLPDGAAIA
jgi:signal transduction histidine kinase